MTVLVSSSGGLAERKEVGAKYHEAGRVFNEASLNWVDIPQWPGRQKAIVRRPNLMFERDKPKETPHG